MPNPSFLPIKQIGFAWFASLLVSSSPRRLDAHMGGLHIILVHRTNRLRLISLASTAFSIGSHSHFPRRQRPSSPMSCTGPLPQGAAMAGGLRSAVTWWPSSPSRPVAAVQPNHLAASGSCLGSHPIFDVWINRAGAPSPSTSADVIILSLLH